MAKLTHGRLLAARTKYIGDPPPIAAMVYGRLRRTVRFPFVNSARARVDAPLGEVQLLADYPFIREVASPLDAHQLRPLDARCEVVQFSTPLADADHQELARFMRGYPNVPLRAYAHYERRPYDLEFLRHYPELMEFQADIYGLEDIGGLRYLPVSLRFLGLGQTKKRHSMAPLRRFRALKNLFLEGHATGFDVVSTLTQLEQLSLRSITLPDLSALLPLKSLESFELRLGGTKDISLLPRIGHLQYLELWMINGLTNLDAIAGIRSLQYLFLQALKNVTSLPSLAPLVALRRVHLETMKGLSDLSPIAAAPALEEFLAIDMRQLTPGSFAPFTGHKHLKAATIGLGSLKKNAAVEKLLGLPKVEKRFAKDVPVS